VGIVVCEPGDARKPLLPGPLEILLTFGIGLRRSRALGGFCFRAPLAAGGRFLRCHLCIHLMVVLIHHLDVSLEIIYNACTVWGLWDNDRKCDE
jgi:hypothetical protein